MTTSLTIISRFHQSWKLCYVNQSENWRTSRIWITISWVEHWNSKNKNTQTNKCAIRTTERKVMKPPRRVTQYTTIYHLWRRRNEQSNFGSTTWVTQKTTTDMEIQPLELKWETLLCRSYSVTIFASRETNVRAGNSTLAALTLVSFRINCSWHWLWPEGRFPKIIYYNMTTTDLTSTWNKRTGLVNFPQTRICKLLQQWASKYP